MASTEKRKICVVTGSRAEYGLLQPLMQSLKEDNSFELQVIASAMHLSPEFGNTFQQIEADGFVLDAKIDMLLSSDSPAATAKSVGIGTISFADALQQLQPDLMVVLGDRFETLSAVQAALFARIPVAHIHGGEITEGVLDDAIRHAITKMSHLHFVSTETYKKRVIQLGEQPENVYVSGAPGVDNIKSLTLMTRQQLEQDLDYNFGELLFLVTYHPTTLADAGGPQSAESASMESLIQALNKFPTANIILTLPNADTGGRHLIAQAKHFAQQQGKRVFVSHSLGRLRYLSLLKFVDCVIGNSSSGLLEAPSFKKPTVNIGDRQRGRIRGASVIDCNDSVEDIEAAIQLALSANFIEKLKSIENPYGDGRAVERIMQVLKTRDYQQLTRKVFYDLPEQDEE